ncbi:acyl-CoA synthetase MbcS [Sediminibacillus massiliensis]|uniref:acyl-CoA synthetase MbcS n=1 Tax=Sediminibacillus massiliensis TaxID=1926277 RepID=UPI000988791D|nr:acyl--CoA ligase [Sediminibacillus massiliensis]
MKREDLIAPESYNIAMEIEKYAEDPSKRALIWENNDGIEKEMTYKELMQNANKIGNVFRKHGLKKGDKILIMMPRLIEAYEIYIAALKTGIIIIPSSEMLRTKDLQYRVTHGEVSGVVSYYPFVDQYKNLEEYDDLLKFSVGKEVAGWKDLDSLKESAPEQLDMTPTSKDDVAFLPYTSGTTGNPKGVVHTHGWGFAHLRTAADNWLAINEGDVVWATAAPGWQKWVWSPLLSVLGTGATGLVYDGKFAAEKYLQLLDKHKVNVLCCTPTEYRLMAKLDNLDQYSLSSLHSAVSAGEPLNREVIDTFENYFNITVRDGYGQTESTLLLGFLKGMKVKAGSMGKPTPGNEVVLINENAEQVAVGQVGDIAIPLDTPALFKEYYKDPERTKKAQRGNYFITGDQASMDEEGYFWFEGRNDDIIVSSGYTIGPFEVEDALIKHKAVKECAVVASPDEVRGNVVKAFVVLQPGMDEKEEGLVKELQNHVKQWTAPYKYPRRIEFVEELPKTSSGKIRRIELREAEKAKYQNQ